MAYQFNGTADALEFGSVPFSVYPLTMASWVNPSVLTGGTVCSVTTAGGTDRIQMYVDSSSSKRVAALVVAGGSTVEASMAGTYSTGSWFHAAAVFSSSSARSAYHNGTLGTGGVPSGTPLTPSGMNRIVLAARYGPTLGGYYTGALAETAIWNTVLSADEIAALADGYRPDLIRPQNLVWYPDLMRTLRDRRSGSLLSAIGSPTIVPHPRRIG